MITGNKIDFCEVGGLFIEINKVERHITLSRVRPVSSTDCCLCSSIGFKIKSASHLTASSSTFSLGRVNMDLRQMQCIFNILFYTKFKLAVSEAQKP